MNIIWVVPLPVTVTTRIITFLVGNPCYKPSFATVNGGGDNPKYKNKTRVFLNKAPGTGTNTHAWNLC